MRFIIIICLFFFSSISIAQETNNKVPFHIQQVNFDLYKKSNDVKNRNTQVKESQIIATQIGYKNVLSIKANQNDYQSIKQIGNKNYYNFTDYYNSRTSKMKVLQNGNSNSLLISGTNSFSDNITIRQNSNYKSLIIRNF